MRQVPLRLELGGLFASRYGLLAFRTVTLFRCVESRDPSTKWQNPTTLTLSKGTEGASQTCPGVAVFACGTGTVLCPTKGAVQRVRSKSDLPTGFSQKSDLPCKFIKLTR